MYLTHVVCPGADLGGVWLNPQRIERVICIQSLTVTFRMRHHDTLTWPTNARIPISEDLNTTNISGEDTLRTPLQRTALGGPYIETPFSKILYLP